MLHQGLEIKDILIHRVSASSQWTVDLGFSVVGNHQIDRLLSEIQSQIDTKNEQFYSHYLIEAHGHRYEAGETENEWKIAQACDRWELVRYEVYRATDQTYQAIVVLFYQPSLNH